VTAASGAEPSPKLLPAFAGHTHPPYALAFSPDGRLLATTDGANKVMLWEMPARR
jgi:hypothetical protein